MSNLLENAPILRGVEGPFFTCRGECRVELSHSPDHMTWFPGYDSPGDEEFIARAYPAGFYCSDCLDEMTLDEESEPPVGISLERFLRESDISMDTLLQNGRRKGGAYAIAERFCGVQRDSNMHTC